MAAARYRQFLRLIQEWPVDEMKAGRDLGALIRQRVADGFKQGESSVIDEVQCQKKYESLVRLNSNQHKNAYPRAKDTTASGVSVEECQVMTATDTLKFFNEDDKSFLSRFQKG